MIGQKKLLEKLNNYNIDNFPRSILLVGELGSGKHTIVDHISKNVLKLPVNDITQNISYEYIESIYLNPNPSIYLINLNDMTEKSQNVLLKFIEEPLKNAFIILITETKNNALNTVLNRCVTFELEAYSNEELAQFVANTEIKDLVLKVLRTPGKLKSVNPDTILELNQLTRNLASRLSAASYPNTLTITNKLNFKDEYDKFDLNLFFDFLIYNLFDLYLTTTNKVYLTLYTFVIDQNKKLSDTRLAKEVFMVNFLTQMWKKVHQHD